jgi:hypothetical protein
MDHRSSFSMALAEVGWSYRSGILRCDVLDRSGVIIRGPRKGLLISVGPEA